MKVTARDINRALWLHFVPRWAMLTEITAATDSGRRLDRRIDVLLVRRAGTDVERLAVEVKVARGDFLADVRNPEKQAPWRRIAHRHAYAVPAGLITVDEVPAGSGLIVVDQLHRQDGGRPTVAFARRAPKGHDPGPLPVTLHLDAWHRACRGEALRLGHGYRPHEDADPAEMRAQITRLQHDLELAHGRGERERALRIEWQRRYAIQTPPSCGTCGEPLHPVARSRRFTNNDWEHRGAAIAARCEELRRAAAQAEQDQRHDQRSGYRSSYLYVPGPEPVETPEPEAATGGAA